MSAVAEDLKPHAAALLRRVLGDVELVSFDRLSGGASQETYRIGYRDAAGDPSWLALRRAPGGATSAMGGPGIEVEALLMRAARAAGVPEPEVLHVLDAEDGLGAGFLMEWIEGEALGARIARSPELAALRPQLARECGEVLARIHAIDVDAAGIADRLERVTPEAYVRATYAQYVGYDVAQPMIDYVARWLLEHLPARAAPALVHGDFRNGNFMVDGTGIVAVLDWELAQIGDPMRDLGWLCTNSWRFGKRELPVGGFGHYEDLFEGYEAVSGRPVDRARVRFWEVFGSFWWSIGCLRMADAYRNGLDRSVERAAIGRRSSECQVDCVNLLIPGPVRLAEPARRERAVDMPRAEELAESVAGFLREDVMEATRGRTHFLARVAANSLDILAREAALGPAARRLALEDLRAFFGVDDGFEALSWRLVEALRNGGLALDEPGLAPLLRNAVVNQVAIDQPRYSGLRFALENAQEPGR